MNFIRKLILFLTIKVIISFNFIEVSQAQEFLSEFANFGPPMTNLKFSATDEPRIEGDRNDAPVNQQKFFLSTPINKVPTDPVSLSWKWSQLNITTDQLLNTGAPVPHHLYESEYSISYKRNENPKKFWGVTLSYGSASDQLFRSYKTTTLNATYYFSESTDPEGRWIWLINYSNNRTFANGIPILGVAYLFTPSPEFTAVFGFPFAFIKSKFADGWSSSLLLGPYIYKLEVAKSLKGPLQAYFALENSNLSFFREERSDEDDRLFYSESKALLGMKSPVTKEMSLDGFVGLAFARALYENDGFNPTSSDKILLENRWFTGIQLSARF